MTDPAARLVAATKREETARRRFDTSLAELRLRVQPSRLAREARSLARDEASNHAGAIAAAGIVSALLLARRPIAGAFRRLKR